MAYYKITDIEVNTTQGSVILTPSSTIAVSNKDKVCFKLFDKIPEAANSYPVFIQANGANIPIWNRYGNPTTAEDVKKGKCYCGYYGSSTPHIIVGNLPRAFNCGSVGNIL